MDSTQNYPIATYVHLGPSLPKHLILGIKRHREMFPDQRITLILDNELDANDFDCVDIFKVDSDALERDLFREMAKYLDFDFRQNFWKFTLQRFFAIHVYHSTVAKQSLLHIESDVLPMSDFPWKEFLGLNTVAWMNVTEFLDVAAVVFLPQFKATDFFISKLKIYAKDNPQINDMQALRKFALDFPREHYYLPSRTPSCSRQQSDFSDSDLEALTRFGGIFDPLALGLWYFGQDPKNSFGMCKRYVDDVSHRLSPSKTGLSLGEISLLMQDKTKVYSLHMHSKSLRLFGPDWKSHLKSGLIQAQHESNAVSFDFAAFRKSIEGRSFAANIWQLLGSMTFFQRLRRIQALESIKNWVKQLLKL